MNNKIAKNIVKGRPPARKGEDKREHILDNALTLFASQGIDGTTVAQIAEASGVTSAMVHYYFNNRKGLLDALATERLAPALEYIWGGVSGEALTNPRLLVTEFVDRLLETVERMPQLPLLWSREILNAGGKLRERVMALIPLDKFDKACRALAEAQQKGKINSEIIPSMVISSAMSVIMLPLAAREILGKIPLVPAMDRAMLRRHALALLLNGLCFNQQGNCE